MSAPNPTRPLTVDDLLTNVKLGKGYHLVRSENVCATEAVAWLAGEPHTQVPKCLSPVICRFLQPWNDNSDQAGRDLLLALLPRTVGTAGDGHDEARGWLAADWLIRVHTPAWLDLAGLSESAGALRALPELQSIAELRRKGPRSVLGRCVGCCAAGRCVGRCGGRPALLLFEKTIELGESERAGLPEPLRP